MFMPGRRLSFVFSLFMLFSGLQFRAIASPAMRSSASFSTIEGEKHVSVTTEGTLEISASDSAGKRSDFYRYSSAWIFLYMLPLGAEDQPDRLLTVWESPTSTTEVVVFNLLSSSHPSTGGSDQARVLLKVGGGGLPSLLYLPNGEIIVIQQRGALSTGRDQGEPSNLVYLWNGVSYKKYSSTVQKGLWSTLESAADELTQRDKPTPTIVKP
jgi:hypothetical protein